MSIYASRAVKSGSLVDVGIKRISDGAIYDFATSGAPASGNTPNQPTINAPEQSGIYKGLFSVTIPTTSDFFVEGDYEVTYHLTAEEKAGIASVFDRERITLSPKGVPITFTIGGVTGTGTIGAPATP